MTLKEILKEFNVTKPKDLPKRPTYKWGNKFYWWRRFPPHSPLHKYKPIVEQIQNGDFNYSPYWSQSNWEEYWMCEDIYNLRKNGDERQESLYYQEDHIIKIARRRIKRLREDAMKDEYNRMESLKKRLKKLYGGEEDFTNKFILNFEGTLEDIILKYPIYIKEYKQNQLNKKFKSWGI